MFSTPVFVQDSAACRLSSRADDVLDSEKLEFPQESMLGKGKGKLGRCDSQAGILPPGRGFTRSDRLSNHFSGETGPRQ